MGIAWAMLVVVLFVPAALPWYYSWPLAVAAPLDQDQGVAHRPSPRVEVRQIIPIAREHRPCRRQRA